MIITPKNVFSTIIVKMKPFKSDPRINKHIELKYENLKAITQELTVRLLEKYRHKNTINADRTINRKDLTSLA